MRVRPEMAEGREPGSADHMNIYQAQQSIEDDPDFCPLVIDTSQDSTGETPPPSDQIIPRFPVHGTRSSAAPSHSMPLPTSPHNHSAAVPGDSVIMDPMNYIQSRCSSVSSSDSQSARTASQLSPNVSGANGKPTGKGSAPCKTRRKGDRILPIGVDQCSGTEKYICPICSDVLVNAGGLTKHIRSHNTSTTATSANSCTICGKILSSQSSLDRHMLVHSGERPFNCRVCQMSFTTNGNMHRHMRIHEKELGGSGASTATTVQREAVSRIRKRRNEHSPEVSTRPVNTRVESTGFQPGQESVKRKLEQEFGKETARKRIVAANGLHLAAPERHRTEIPYAGRRDQSASITQPGSSSDRTDKSDVTMWPCSVCDKMFLCAYSLGSHMTDQHRDMTSVCPQCFLVCHTPQALQIHMATTHNKAINGVVGHRSESRSLPIGFHKLDHLPFSSNKFVQVARVYCEQNQQRASSMSHDFTCLRCHHAFPSAAILKQHMDTHAPERNSTCTVCNCSFVSRTAYKNHMAGHASSRVINNYSKLLGTDDNDLQDAVSKSEFMLVLGMQSAKGKKPSQKMYRDMSINNVYHNKLSDMSAENGNIIVQSQRELELAKDDHVMKGCALLEQLQAPTMMNPSPSTLFPSASLPKPSQHAASLNSNQPRSYVPGIHGNRDGAANETPILSLCIKKEPEDSNPETPEMRSSVSNESVMDDTSDHSLEGASMRDYREDQYMCKYCDESCASYRTLRAHERCHLGLSPYRCNLCSYSSTDKSTLVRHLRTHNGERPFQCSICHFAFTTKANCERHVRKRHGRIYKDEIEAAIDYNRLAMENSHEQEAFASPDTVCKYCGEDLKFFRALKHHLRSHSSCRHKPFMCKLCTNGFLTKANCMRHIQKQHLEVEQNKIENHILVNDIPEMDGQNDEGKCPPGKSSGSSDSMLSSTPVTLSPWGLPIPRESPIIYNNHYNSSTYITTPPVPIVNKIKAEQEPTDSGFDQPLDFSMKSLKQEDSEKMVMSKSYSDEVPMDLSVNKPELKYPRALYPVHAPVLQHTSLTPHHLMQLQAPGDELPYQCGLCTAEFSINTNLERHLKMRHPQELSANPHLLYSKKEINSKSLNYNTTDLSSHRETNNNIKSYISQSKTSLDSKSPNGSAYSSDTELASVTRILDATNAMKFKSFFREQTDTSPIGLSTTPVIQESQYVSVLANGKPVIDVNSSQDLDLSCATPDSDSISSLNPTPDHMTTSPDDMILQYDDDEQDSENRKKKHNSYSDSPHKLQCPYCPRAFPWISSLKRHILTHTGQKPFKCPKCPVTFSTKSNRERHMVRKHGLDVHDPATRQMMDRPFKCHLCVFSSFSTAGNLLKHYKDRHPEREMPQQLASSLAAHYAINGIDTLSDLGDSLSTTSEMSNRSSAIINLMGFEEEDEEDEELIQDSLSQKLLDHPRYQNCRSSVSPTPSDQPIPWTVHDVTPPPPLVTPPSNTPPPLITVWDNTPDRHINPERDNYNVDKITNCWKCGAIYESRKNLLRHLKEHNIDFPFKCYLCDASFENRVDSLEHKMTRHSGDWEMIREKNKIHQHVEFAATQEQLVQDTLSGKIFKAPENNEDTKIETDYAQRKVYCSLCTKRFWSLQDLRRHMRSHTGERPFECDICQARFTLKHSMMRHRRKHCNADGASGPSDDDCSLHAEDNSDSLRPVTSITGHRSHRSTSQKLHRVRGKLGTSVRHDQTQRAQGKCDVPEQDDDGDLLHNLLGVENDAINLILDSADDAATLLGVRKVATK